MSVFNPGYAGGYDQLYLEKDYSGECDLIEQALNLGGRPARPIRLLDVGCGTGGHVLELARRGYEMVGVDQSEAMLELAKNKAKVAGLNQDPSWIVQDARNLTLGTPFDGAVMMFAVLGYLNGNEDILAALSSIRKHLNVGGRFLCDVWWGPAVLTERPGDRVRVVQTPQGQLIRTTHTRLESLTNTAEVQFQLFRVPSQDAGAASNETHRMRYFFGPELHLLFGISGFRIIGLSAFPSLQAALTEHTWNACVLAEAVE